MTKAEIARETRKQRRLEILRTNTPRCGTCGEDRWQCIERHHPSGRKQDAETTVLECRNCHRVLSDDQRDHPEAGYGADAMLELIGHFMLGLADMLRIIIEKLYEFGRALIERASATVETEPA